MRGSTFSAVMSAITTMIATVIDIVGDADDNEE